MERAEPASRDALADRAVPGERLHGRPGPTRGVGCLALKPTTFAATASGPCIGNRTTGYGPGVATPPDDVPAWRVGRRSELAAWVLAFAAIVAMAFQPPFFVVVLLACVGLVSLEWAYREWRREVARRTGLDRLSRGHPARWWLEIVGAVLLLDVAAARGVSDWLLEGLPIVALCGLVIWFVIKMRSQRHP
jgi:hypothetical protein